MRVACPPPTPADPRSPPLLCACAGGRPWAPSLDAGEVTDKGSINQKAVLRNRAGLVEALYAAPPGPHVVVV